MHTRVYKISFIERRKGNKMYTKFHSTVVYEYKNILYILLLFILWKRRGITEMSNISRRKYYRCPLSNARTWYVQNHTIKYSNYYCFFLNISHARKCDQLYIIIYTISVSFPLFLFRKIKLIFILYNFEK